MCKWITNTLISACVVQKREIQLTFITQTSICHVYKQEMMQWGGDANHDQINELEI